MPISKIGSKGVKDAELTADDLAPGTITSAKIAPGTIASDRIAPGTIANDRLANNTTTINGTSIALGASGTIVAGTDWQAVKTANYTATAGQGIFASTSGGAWTLTLPASPTIGDEVTIVDYNESFGTNNLTIDPNGSKFDGKTGNTTMDTDGKNVRFVFTDATRGWVPVFDDVPGNYGPVYIGATGGTETTSGDYKIHTFNSSSNFVVSEASNQGHTVEYLVVAGGASGGTGCAGGGGGAGGYRTNYPSPDTGGLAVSAQTYPVTVGGGASAVAGPQPGNSGNAVGTDGSTSTFSTITSAGGGGGSSNNTTSGRDGGSGGGAAHSGSPIGSGNVPPVSPPQGNNGGASVPSGSPDDVGGGGGGASAAGNQFPGSPTQNSGGAGSPNAISGSATTYAGGGGGGRRDIPGALSHARSSGGAGGGGNGGTGNTPGSNAPNKGGTNGSANTGGGGGAGARGGPYPGPPGSGPSGAGGSGVVIVRYKYQN